MAFSTSSIAAIKGDTGAQGVQGAQGDTGPAGSIDLTADQSWTGSQRATPVAVTPSSNIATFDLNAGQNFTCTTDSGASTELTFSNLTTGQSGFIELAIPSAGGSGVTLPSSSPAVKSPGGTGATDLATDQTHLVSYLVVGSTTVYITYGLNMS